MKIAYNLFMQKIKKKIKEKMKILFLCKDDNRSYTTMYLFVWLCSFLTVYLFTVNLSEEILLHLKNPLRYHDIWINSFYFIKWFIMLFIDFILIFNVMTLNLKLNKFLDLLFLILLNQTRFLYKLSISSIKINFIDFILQELIFNNITVFFNAFFIIFWHIFFLIFIVILWLSSQYDFKYNKNTRYAVFYSFTALSIILLFINFFIIFYN